MSMLGLARQSFAEVVGMGDVTQDPPEFVIGMTEAKVLGSNLEEVLQVLDRRPSSRNVGSLFTGSTQLRDRLLIFVKDMQATARMDNNYPFVHCLTRCAEAQQTLMERRQRLAQEVADGVAGPMRSLLDEEVREVMRVKQSYERQRRVFDAARAKANGARGGRSVDGSRVLQSETELSRERERYEVMRDEATGKGIELSLKKDVVVVGQVREMVQTQLRFFRECVKDLEQLGEVTERMEKFVKEQGEALNEVRAVRVARSHARLENALKNRYTGLTRLFLAPSFDLVSALLEAVPQAGSEQFVTSVLHVMESKGQALPLLEGDLTTQLKEAADKGGNDALLVFRNSSTVNRLLSVYSKIVCTKWVEDSISDCLRSVDANPFLYDIDPERLKEEFGEGAEAALKSHVQALSEACGCVLRRLRTSPCPPQIRHLCKHIREQTARSRHGGQEQQTRGGDLAVGTFLFLRLVCPAILARASNNAAIAAGGASQPDEQREQADGASSPAPVSVSPSLSASIHGGNVSTTPAPRKSQDSSPVQSLRSPSLSRTSPRVLIPPPTPTSPKPIPRAIQNAGVIKSPPVSSSAPPSTIPGPMVLSVPPISTSPQGPRKSPSSTSTARQKYRALVLIAKTLQGIASEGTTGLKEATMKPLAPFISQWRAEVTSWYDDLTNITQEELDRMEPLVDPESVINVDLPDLENVCRTYVREISRVLPKSVFFELAEALAEMAHFHESVMLH